MDKSFDPREQDRESDEVDVCIVGGGKHTLILGVNLPLTGPRRSSRPQRRHSP